MGCDREKLKKCYRKIEKKSHFDSVPKVISPTGSNTISASQLFDTLHCKNSFSINSKYLSKAFIPSGIKLI